MMLHWFMRGTYISCRTCITQATGGGKRKGGWMLLCLLFLSVMPINTPRALAAECNKSRVKRNHRPTDCIVADRRRCKIGKQQMNLWLPRCEASTTRWKEHADLRISLFWRTNPSEFPTTAARVAGLKSTFPIGKEKQEKNLYSTVGRSILSFWSLFCTFLLILL